MAEQSEKSTVNCQQPQLSQKAEKRSTVLFRPSGPHQFFFVFKANGRAPGGVGAMPARHDDKTP